MEEIRCTECGELLSKEMKECPKCGCPVSYPQKECAAEIEKKEQTSYVVKPEGQNSKINIMPIFSLIIGVIVVILGFTVLSHKTNLEIYDASVYNVDKAVFGADFYTEIYSASDTIVDELNDINSGISSLSGSIVAVIDAIYYGAGMIIIALGLGIISISFINIGKSKR